jgi:hypothetical protein
MKELIKKDIIIKYIGKLSDINDNYKFDIIIDESSNYGYIKDIVEKNDVEIILDNKVIFLDKLKNKDLYKPIYDEYIKLLDEKVHCHYIENNELFSYIVYKYNKLITSNKDEHKYEYEYELKNMKVDRDTGREIKDSDYNKNEDSDDDEHCNNLKRHYNFSSDTESYYDVDIRKSWRKEELINTTTDKEDIRRLGYLYNMYYYTDYKITSQQRKDNWSHVVKLIKTMLEFITTISKEACVNNLYDYYNNQIIKFEKYKKLYLVNILTLFCRRFMFEDDNFVSYNNYTNNYTNNINVIDYSYSSKNKYYNDYDDDNGERITVITIIFNNNKKLYYEENYHMQSLEGHIITKLDDIDIPINLHKKFYNNIICFLEKYI